MMKEKDKILSEIKLKFFNLQKKYADDIQNLIREKLDLSLQLESLKPTIEKKDDFIKDYSEESLERAKKLKTQVSSVAKEWEERYYSLQKKYRDLEKKYSEETEENSKELKRLYLHNTDLEKKIEGLKNQVQEIPKLEEQVRELESELLLHVPDSNILKSSRSIKEAGQIIDEKNKEIRELREKLSEASLKISELSGPRKIPSLTEKELQMKIEELNAEIVSLNKELAYSHDKDKKIIYFGEKDTIECIKEIIKGTKRNILLFIPKFSQLAQLDLNSLPPRIRIQVATSAALNDRQQVLALDSYKDKENIKIKNYPPADIYGIVSDSATLFIGFTDNKGVPVGFKSTKPSLISFLGGLLNDSFHRFAKPFKI